MWFDKTNSLQYVDLIDIKSIFVVQTSKAMIPFPIFTPDVAMAKCDNDSVTATIELDGNDVTITMLFSKNAKKYSLAADTTYDITVVSLFYQKMNRYFPNHIGK